MFRAAVEDDVARREDSLLWIHDGDCLSVCKVWMVLCITEMGGAMLEVGFMGRWTKVLRLEIKGQRRLKVRPTRVMRRT